MTVLLVRRKGHDSVRVGRRLEGPEALHVRDIEHVQGCFEAHRDALAVELDGQHGREEVDLTDGVVLFCVPEAEPTRAIFRCTRPAVVAYVQRCRLGGAGAGGG